MDLRVCGEVAGAFQILVSRGIREVFIEVKLYHNLGFFRFDFNQASYASFGDDNACQNDQESD